MGIGRGKVWLWAGWICFAAVIFIPSVWFFAVSLRSQFGQALQGDIAAITPDARTSGLVLRTVVLSAGAATLALILGTATGYLTTRTRFFGRRVAFVLLLVPFFIPAHSYALSWIEWFAPRTPAADASASVALVYSLAGAIVVLSLHLFPWIHFVAGVGFASIEPHHDETARIALPPGRRTARISLPLVAGLLAMAALFVFVVGVKNQSIPETLRQRVFATEILLAYQEQPDGRQAALDGLACVAVSTLALGMGLWIAVRRRRIAIEGLSSPLKETEGEGLPNARWAAVFLLIVFSLAAVLPVAALVKTAGFGSSYSTVWRSAWPQAVFGLVASAAVATLCVGFGFLLAEVLTYANRPFAAVTILAVFLLFALPAPVLDIGLIQFWNRPRIDSPWPLKVLYDSMSALYDTPAMLILGQTAALLPVAVFGFWVARRRIDPHLIEATALAGLPWGAVALRILLPMLRGWIVGIWGIVFVLALNDVEAAVLLAPAGQTTLSVRIMTLLHFMPDEQVSALCVIQVILTAGAIAIAAGVILLMGAWASLPANRSSGRPKQ